MNIEDLDLEETFEAFDQAQADGDVGLMASLLAHAQRLSGRPAQPAVTAAAGQAGTVPTSITLSTAVIAADPPRNLDGHDRCSICRCHYPGSDSRVSMTEVPSRGIKVCARCAARKPALVT